MKAPKIAKQWIAASSLTIEKNPEEANALITRSIAYKLLGMWKRMTKDVLILKKILPQDYRVLLLDASLVFHQQEYLKAIELLKQAEALMGLKESKRFEPNKRIDTLNSQEIGLQLDHHLLEISETFPR